jgi:hypothetical protein
LWTKGHGVFFSFSAEYEAPCYIIFSSLFFLRFSCVQLPQHMNLVFSPVVTTLQRSSQHFLSDTRLTRNGINCPWWNGTIEGQNYERDECLFGNELLGVGFVLGAY